MAPRCPALLAAALVLLLAPSAVPAAAAAAAAASAASDPAANASAHGAAQFAALAELGERLNVKWPLLAAFNQAAEAWASGSCVLTPVGQEDLCCPAPELECDSSTGAVTKIYFERYDSAGPASFPSEGWAALSSLEFVRLNGIHLEGPLPPSDLPASLRELALTIGNLSSVSPAWRAPASLTHLDLTQNAINQTLAELQPWMPSARALQWLKLDMNALRGTIPHNLSLPPNLKHLYLRWNQLTGTLPPLRLPASLASLYMFSNPLHGPLPAGWALPDSLRALDLADTGLTGTLPATVHLPLQLEDLDLSHNRLSGTIPDGWLPPALLRLFLSNNPLGGHFPIPSSLPASLIDLRLSDCNLSGPLPGSLHTPSPAWIDASANQLSGTLPATLLGQLPPTLQRLDLSNNALTGTIPRELVAPAGLELKLSNNSFSGTLPTAWKLGPGVSLGLAGNRLRGRLRAESLRNVASADLTYNLMTGPLPAWPPRADAVAGPPTLVVLPQRQGAGFCGEVPVSPVYLRRDANGTEVILGTGDLPACP